MKKIILSSFIAVGFIMPTTVMVRNIVTSTTMKETKDTRKPISFNWRL